MWTGGIEARPMTGFSAECTLLAMILRTVYRTVFLQDGEVGGAPGTEGWKTWCGQVCLRLSLC